MYIYDRTHFHQLEEKSIQMTFSNFIDMIPIKPFIENKQKRLRFHYKDVESNFLVIFQRGRDEEWILYTHYSLKRANTFSQRLICKHTLS